MRFECSRLVETDCTVPEDIIPGELHDENRRLLVLKTQNSISPTSALFLENQSIFEDTHSRKIFDVNVIRKFCAKGDNVSKVQCHDLVAEYKVSGDARVGIKVRRGFSFLLSRLISGVFNVPAPREAKCCQGWFDKVIDANDASDNLKNR